jgi:sialic acid synthase SpsE
MKQLVVETERASQALGSIHYGRTSAEEKSLVFRRSLYIAEDIKAGDILTPKNLRAIRPGNGLAPKYYEIFLGKTVRQNVERGTPVTWDLLL